MTNSTGLINLISLGTALYLGFQGGLYPGGSNVMPTSHARAALRQLVHVEPRDAAGNPDPEGKVGFLAIGPSYLQGAFSRAMVTMDADPMKAPELVAVNGALGASPASAMQDPASPYWTHVASQVTAAGLAPLQVQVIWFEIANEHPSTGFPIAAQVLQAHGVAILNNLRADYPNARLCYVESRAYAGHATSTLNPEPYAYEQGLAMKWLIEQQISGDPALLFNANLGTPVAPWIGWGNYQWADGIVPNPDGLTWVAGDFSNDGTHLSVQGQDKVAARIVDFVQNNLIASAWYLD